jgi:hypothetical protein
MHTLQEYFNLFLYINKWHFGLYESWKRTVFTLRFSTARSLCKVKVKLSLCLTKQTYWESGGKAPHITHINLDTRWRCGQLHAPAALPPGKILRYPFGRRLGGPQRRWRKETKIPAPDENRTPVVEPVAQSLHRLSYPAPLQVRYLQKK